MARVIIGVTLSLDGFMAGPAGNVDTLYSDLADLQDTDYMQSLAFETGAVLMGRRTFEMGDPDLYADTYELQSPIFVVTHQPPANHPRENSRLTFTFVTDGVESAVRQAKAAAGDKVVTVVGGADLARQLVKADVVDELRVDIMPVLLGAGLRFFDGAEWGRVRLERSGIAEVGRRTTLRFRVVS